MMPYLTDDVLWNEFIKYDTRVRNELIIKSNDHGYIEAVYIRSPQELNLYYCLLQASAWKQYGWSCKKY